MTQKTDAFGSLALSPPPRSVARVLSKTMDGHRTLSTASTSGRPVQSAELAQARMFEGLLQAERAELQELAGGSRRAEDLTLIRTRLDEVHALLGALRGRFPHTESDTLR